VTPEAYGLTDVGRRREANEDQFLVDAGLGLYAVADGMGGHAAGEVASQLAIQTLADTLRETGWTGDETDCDAAQQSLNEAVRKANQRICETVLAREEWRGMGTTVVALLMCGENAVIAHVGDSRAYMLRGGDFRRLTSDHSWVNEQVRLGLLTDDDAQRHPMRNIVTRALGNRMDVAVDFTNEPMRDGDVILLCSDGLNTMLSDDEIRATLASHEGNPEEACRALVDAANDRGGEDNTTVIVLRRQPDGA
jgi:protein phosphatase